MLDCNALMLSVLQTITSTAVIKPEKKVAWLETVKMRSQIIVCEKVSGDIIVFLFGQC